jgi:hypothetical protein
MARAMGGFDNFNRFSPLRLARLHPEKMHAGSCLEPPASVIAAASTTQTRTGSDETSEVPVEKSEKTDGDDSARRRVDWAPMGIMDTEENISLGDIFAEARNLVKMKTRKDLGDDVAPSFDSDARAPEKQREIEADRLFARRRRAPPPGPPVGTFHGDEAARQAGYAHVSFNGVSSEVSDGSGDRHSPDCFPPAYLFAGCADTTVPWFESAEFHLALTDAGARSRALLYLKETHGSFVLNWSPRDRSDRGDANEVDGEPHTRGSLSAEGLAPYCRDIVRVIKHA